MNDAAFASATRQRPQTILRVPLLPYSLGHELILLAANNPLLAPQADFLKLEAAAQRASIMRATSVCSRTWIENQKADRWVRLWGRFIKRDNFAVAIADFRNYRQEGSTFPDTLPNEDASGGRNLGAPLLSRLILWGTPVYGESVFDQPLGMIQWLYFTHAEHEGGCRIENADERKVREESARLEAEILAEQAAKTKGGDACPL